MRTPWRYVALASTAAIALAFVPTAALADAQEGTDTPITLDLYNLTDAHVHI